MTPTTYTVMHTRLQDKWRCAHHTGSFCYVDPTSNHHIHLSPAELGIWATAIIHEAATISCPPRSVEFDKILNPKKKGGSTAKTTPQNVEIHEDHVNSNKPIIHYHMLPPTIAAAPRQEEPTPKKKRRRSSIHALKSSPIPGFEVPEYNSKGLLAYLKWCTDKYHDCEFMDAYGSLSKHKMGIDVILAVTALDLHKVCDISFGTAIRIIHCYPKWLLELKSTVIHLYMTVSELIHSNLRRNYSSCNFKNFFG